MLLKSSVKEITEPLLHHGNQVSPWQLMLYGRKAPVFVLSDRKEHKNIMGVEQERLAGLK